MKAEERSTLTRLLLEGLFLALLVAYVVAGKDMVPFHADESAFIRMSRDYRYLKQGDVARIAYVPRREDGSREQRVRLTTGSISSLLIGVARDLAGLGSVEENGFWIWDYSGGPAEANWRENMEHRRLPDPVSLSVARWPSTVLGAGAVVLLFLTLRQLTSSRIAAWTGSLLLATGPLFLICVRRAMQEGAKLFFLTLTLYCASRIVHRLKSGESKWTEFLYLGIASGITLAAKQDVAMALAGIYLGLAPAPLFRRGGAARVPRHLLQLAAATCTAGAVFFALMPVWWDYLLVAMLLACLALLLFQATAGSGHLPKRLLGPVIALLALTVVAPSVWPDSLQPFKVMIQQRKKTLATQVAYRSRFDLPQLDNYARRAAFLTREVCTSRVQYYETPRFDVSAIHRQIDEYESSVFSGRRYLLADIVVMILLAAGIWTMVRRFLVEDLLILSVFLLTALVLFLTVPVAMDRYYVVLQLPLACIAGIGAQAAVGRVQQMGGGSRSAGPVP